MEQIPELIKPIISDILFYDRTGMNEDAVHKGVNKFCEKIKSNKTVQVSTKPDLKHLKKDGLKKTKEKEGVVDIVGVDRLTYSKITHEKEHNDLVTVPVRQFTKNGQEQFIHNTQIYELVEDTDAVVGKEYYYANSESNILEVILVHKSPDISHKSPKNNRYSFDNTDEIVEFTYNGVKYSVKKPRNIKYIVMDKNTGQFDNTNFLYTINHENGGGRQKRNKKSRKQKRRRVRKSRRNRRS